VVSFPSFQSWTLGLFNWTRSCTHAPLSRALSLSIDGSLSLRWAHRENKRIGSERPIIIIKSWKSKSKSTNHQKGGGGGVRRTGIAAESDLCSFPPRFSASLPLTHTPTLTAPPFRYDTQIHPRSLSLQFCCCSLPLSQSFKLRFNKNIT